MRQNIDMINDLGAPALVTAINVTTRATTMTALGQPVSELMPYVLTVGGYLAAYMGWGGRQSAFIKNVAIAAAPLAFEKLYNRARGTVVNSRPLSRASRVSRYPGPAAEPAFQGTRLV